MNTSNRERTNSNDHANMDHQSIAEHRAEIDRVDAELLRLLNQRARMASKLLALKRSLGLPICDPQRELEVLGRVCVGNPGPLEKEAILAIFQRIIEET